jgi:FtsX-like permease family
MRRQSVIVAFASGRDCAIRFHSMKEETPPPAPPTLARTAAVANQVTLAPALGPVGGIRPGLVTELRTLDGKLAIDLPHGVANRRHERQGVARGAHAATRWAAARLGSRVPHRHCLRPSQRYSLADAPAGTRVRVALILAVLGLYGVMAYAATQRTPEIGIRLAMGAQPASIVTLLLGQGLRLLGIGVAIGFTGALLGTRYIEAQLFGVTATDPLTFVGGCVVLAIAGLTASVIPALRAMHVDPVIALGRT